MVNFRMTMGGVQVEVDGQPFGNISPDRGFFTSPATMRQFLEIRSEDLREIADKADEMKNRKRVRIEPLNVAG